jgi:hypothetical protein
MKQRLGSQLRDAYKHVLDEPLPDRFRELLNRLDDPRLG